MSIGSFRTLILHQDLVEAIAQSSLTGVRFHETTPIEGKVNQYLSQPAPKYYIVEATGDSEFIPLPEEFKILECICELEHLNFGSLKSPLIIKKNTWNGSDFFKLTNFYNYAYMTFVTKNVVDLIVEKGWENEFWLGDPILPGIFNRDFSEGWYERTLADLQKKFPNYRVLDDEKS